jgi:hypothetical protein
MKCKRCCLRVARVASSGQLRVAPTPGSLKQGRLPARTTRSYPELPGEKPPGRMPIPSAAGAPCLQPEGRGGRRASLRSTLAASQAFERMHILCQKVECVHVLKGLTRTLPACHTRLRSHSSEITLAVPVAGAHWPPPDDS